MHIVRMIAAILLALPLVFFGANYFGNFMPPPEAAPSPGMDILVKMREGGMMLWIALSHLLIGVLLLVPRFRFAAGMLQLPLTLGIVAFHVTLMPEGTPMALALLLCNIVAIWEPARIKQLM